MIENKTELDPAYKGFFAIEMFLRQRGDFKGLLAVDAVILRTDLSGEQKTAEIHQIIQERLNGKR